MHFNQPIDKDSSDIVVELGLSLEIPGLTCEKRLGLNHMLLNILSVLRDFLHHLFCTLVGLAQLRENLFLASLLEKLSLCFQVQFVA